jgi:two-component system response regulator HydG
MSETFPSDLLHSLPEAAFAITLDKRVIDMNGAAEMLTGVQADAARGRPCSAIVRCEVCGPYCPLDAAVERGEAVTSFNVRLLAARDEEPVRLHTAPVRLGRSGPTVGVLESLRPIGHLVGLFGALREKSDQLERERNRAQAVLDSIGEGVLALDADRVVTAVNRTAERITGYAESEIVGRVCTEFLACRAECARACPVLKVLGGGQTVTNFETEFRDRAGRVLPVSLSVAPLHDTRGEIVGAVETFRDLRTLLPATAAPAGLVVGNTRRMRQIVEFVQVLKDSDATVLLQGESGTGKGLLAGTIHRAGRRAQKPFVTVTCSALPEGLLESELFGHVRGAFTGAIRDTVGRFELADGGTIFLDEVAELSPAMQVKLLRFLQDHEFERVGSTKTVRVDVRVIAATNQDLHRATMEGRFRTDLFYRLNVIPIELPPLRERREDLPLLVDHVLGRLAAKGRTVRTVSPEVMELFLQYPWPGNIRELENVLEHAALCSRGSVIDVEALPRSLLRPHPAPTPRPRADEMERTLEMVARHHGNQSRAARALGISRTTLWRRLRRLGMGSTRSAPH